ncbi:hypothetical protein INT45_013765 [Circinella minor]|uniref:Uncharacterized protein n=1 Tax=Circinella minor TaxID=1195481 RepID=A0A8H7RMN8_9FUNG|nr:hypothetical protein INT45_013765 [Circinella minor]
MCIEDEVTRSTGSAMSLCSSLQSREIVCQFSVLGISASVSRHAAIPPALTWEVSMDSVGTGGNASANSRTTYSTTTMVSGKKRMLGNNNNNNKEDKELVEFETN